MGNFKTVTNPELDHDTTKKGDVENPNTRSLEEIEEEIKKYKKTSDESYLEMGRLFLEAKNKFGKKHGDWLKWLQDDVKDISICKVQRLMRVAKWVDGNEAPVPHLDFTKAYILSRLSGKDFKKLQENKLQKGKQIETMTKQELQDAVRDYLRDKPRKGTSTVKTTAQQQSNVSTENSLQQRFEKIRDEVSELAGLVKENPGEYEQLAEELREFVVQQFPPKDSGDPVDD